MREENTNYDSQTATESITEELTENLERSLTEDRTETLVGTTAGTETSTAFGTETGTVSATSTGTNADTSTGTASLDTSTFGHAGQGHSYEDTYRIVKLLGQGGMSAVYLAEHKVWRNLWALKIVEKKQNSFDMLAEPNLLKQLSHPMLPHIVDFYEDDEQICIVEDYISGEDLRHYVARNGPISEALALDWLRQLCDVLQYLHTREPSPIIYRDLKPANVMLREDGSLCLIDFGIARRYNLDGGADTVHAWTMGYAAPEQMSSTVQTDARADIYSLGATMFRLLAGKDAKYLPGLFPRIRSLRPEISPVMDEVLDRCLKPNREERYASIEELLADLDRPAGRRGKAEKGGRKRTLITAAVVFLLAAAGTFGAMRGLPGFLQDGREAETTQENDRETGQSAQGTGQPLSQEDVIGESGAQGSQISIMQLDKASREKYESLLVKLYGAFENNDYESVAEILQEENDSDLFAQLVRELETGDKYLVYDEMSTEKVLAVYRYGLLYFGEWKDNKREGYGIWYALGDAEELHFEGEWADNLPQGEGKIVVIARRKPEEWGDVYPVRQERDGTFTEGFYDGDFQIRWEMSDGSTRDYTPVRYEMGVSETCTSEEIEDALVDFGYARSQARELADEHLRDESSLNKKTIAVCRDSEGRIFTMVEYLENGAEPLNSVFGIHM